MIRPALTYTPDFVADPAALFATMRDEVAWTQQMKSRRTASMGVPYNYTSASYPVAPWHPAVQALRERVARAVGFMPTNCLLNDYPTGEHRLGWHADDVSILAPGTGIAIVSLGAERALGLRTRGDEGFVYQQIPLAA
ncbi:MAG: alpha-ketoglutarate-dependent dioxygenase AlkB, partial [Myxococcales bacterium]|nr:alpha-ketoglutarate-dependent dioxygenase AlkB [Myxococcales bacterium]